MTVFIVLGAVCALALVLFLRLKKPAWGVGRTLLCYLGAWAVIVGTVFIVGIIRGPTVYASIDDYVKRDRAVVEVLAVADGEDSCLVITRERTRKAHVLLKKLEGGYEVRTGRSTKLKLLDNLSMRLIYSKHSKDRFICFFDSGAEAPSYADSERSVFNSALLSVHPQDSDLKSYMVIAYVGQKPVEYYKTEYWISPGASG